MIRLAKGQRVRALRDIWWHGLGTVAHAGDEGTIVGVGVDGRFGLAQVQFGGMDAGLALPLLVAPVARVDPHVELAQEPVR